MKPCILATVLLACSTLATGGGFGMPQQRGPGLPSAPPGSLLPPQQGFDSRGPNEGRGDMSARDAAREAQQMNGGGRVLAVESANGGWRVKLLKEGNVRIVYVPQ